MMADETGQEDEEQHDGGTGDPKGRRSGSRISVGGRPVLGMRVPVSMVAAPRFSSTEVREWAAAGLAAALMLVLFVSVGLTFALAFQKTANVATDVAQVVIPPITTLLAAVLAYYYAFRQSS